MDRRHFFKTSAVGAVLLQASDLLAADKEQPSSYVRANTDWLAKCRFGIGVHWTAQTVPKKGPRLPFQEGVDAFDVKKFIDAVVYSGADYVLFTATHALQMLPAPNPMIDKLCPGRTCRRDLIAELADGLAAQGKHFLVYYNHSCNGQDDPEWRKAVGYDGRDKDLFAQNLIDIIGWMSDRYGEKVKAWWFDSPYSLDARGPHQSVTTDMTGFSFPWERYSAAAKKGFPGRLVTYNSGVGETFLYTTHQDYWAGELVDLKTPAKARYLENGLQWFGWTCLEDRGWVHWEPNTEIPKPLYPDEEVIAYVRACNSHQAPMTFNLGIYQDGAMPPASIEQLRRLGLALRG